MSGRPRHTHKRGHSWEPRIVEPDPVIIYRSPSASPVSLEEPRQTRRSSFSLFRIPDLLSGRRSTTTVYTVRRKGKDREEDTSESRPTSRRGRASSPPRVAIHRSRTSQSTPPIGRISNMSPKDGQSGFVPLPDKLPPLKKESRSTRTDKGKEPKVEERSPYGYNISDDFPSSSRTAPRQYEHVSTTIANDSNRSRSDNRTSKEYNNIKAHLEDKTRDFEDAARRLTTQKNYVHNLEGQLEDMENRVSQAQEELDDARRKLKQIDRECQESSNEVKLAQNMLDLERQKREERRRDKERTDSDDKVRDRSGGSGSGNDRRRRHPHKVDQIHQDESRPRTINPRGSSASANIGGDAGLDAIAKARADAARKGKGKV